MVDDHGLSGEQRRAITWLVATDSAAETAARLNLKTSVVERWLEDPLFHKVYRACLRKERRDTIERLESELTRPGRPPRKLSANGSTPPPIADAPQAPALGRIPDPADAVVAAGATTGPRGPESGSTPPSDGFSPDRAVVQRPEIALDYPDVVSAVHRAQDRDTLVRIALQYACQIWSRNLWFVRTNNELRGWAYAGRDRPPGSPRSLCIALEEDSAFAAVVADRSVFRGRLDVGNPVHRSILADIGPIPAPVESILLPVELSGKTLCLLYADTGSDPFRVKADLSDLYRLPTLISGGLTRLVRQRRAQQG